MTNPQPVLEAWTILKAKMIQTINRLPKPPPASASSGMELFKKKMNILQKAEDKFKPIKLLMDQHNWTELQRLHESGEFNDHYE